MKKILKGTTIALLLMFSFSCEKDDSELSIESTIEQGKIKESNLKSKSSLGTFCEIIGSTVTIPEEAIVNAGSTVSYSYINNKGTSSSINWEFTSLVPQGSATLSQNGSNVTVTFNSNFTSGILLAVGTGGPALDCTAELNITEAGEAPCASLSGNVTASGPSYMSGTTNAITWNYTGDANAAVSIRWWYQKTWGDGPAAAPYVIGHGENPSFMTSPSSYYSNNSDRTSVFRIYLEVTDDCGDTYISPDYFITKKGKYELGDGGR